MGYVSDTALNQLYARADLFVFPTLAEGFGMPPLEAMARGCPVIASRCGSLPEVCGDAAYYVDERDPRAIADGIVRVLTDHTLRRGLARMGRERARRYEWSRSARHVFRLLEEVAEAPLGSRPRAASRVSSG
jgi:glycosyltransferase involved in cell wall biosynthesis